MTAWQLLAEPFATFGFMRRALVACLALALGSAPMGVLLVLRRMSLIGDAMAHAVLPGAAIGFLVAGLSLGAMALGGLVAGLVVAVLAGLVTRVTPVREDASFAGFYLISLAFGVVVVSMKGSSVDLLHVLFGTILAVDDAALVHVAAIATLTLAALALLWRPLVADAFDPEFLAAQGEPAGLYHTAFLVLVVLNLVAAFQALGTLMAVGLMMLPAVGARFWAASVAGQMTAAALTAALAGIVGLLVSFHAGLPSGPAIVLAAGALWLLSLLLGARGGLLIRALPLRHLEA